VVVVLLGSADRSSTPADAEVMAASVVSGSISETAATKVVLPTPKPPAMTILTGVGGCWGDAPARSELVESIEHPLEKRKVWAVADSGGPMQDDEPFLCHVPDEDAGDTQRQVQARRHLRDRQ
jgi:hypothetical protein